MSYPFMSRDHSPLHRTSRGGSSPAVQAAGRRRFTAEHLDRRPSLEGGSGPRWSMQCATPPLIADSNSFEFGFKTGFFNQNSVEGKTRGSKETNRSAESKATRTTLGFFAGTVAPPSKLRCRSRVVTCAGRRQRSVPPSPSADPFGSKLDLAARDPLGERHSVTSPPRSDERAVAKVTIRRPASNERQRESTHKKQTDYSYIEVKSPRASPTPSVRRRASVGRRARLVLRRAVRSFGAPTSKAEAGRRARSLRWTLDPRSSGIRSRPTRVLLLRSEAYREPAPARINLTVDMLESPVLSSKTASPGESVLPRCS